MRRTGKTSVVPAIGMNVPGTMNGVRDCAWACPGSAYVTTPPAARAAAVRSRSRRFPDFIGGSPCLWLVEDFAGANSFARCRHVYPCGPNEFGPTNLAPL